MVLALGDTHSRGALARAYGTKGFRYIPAPGRSGAGEIELGKQ